MPNRFDLMADEADNYANLLADMSSIDFKTLQRGLINQYDVIVAEAMDYVIKLDRVDEFTAELLKLSRIGKSYLIAGRLRMCAALTNDKDLEKALFTSPCEDDDEYCQVWESAACYVRSNNQDCLESLQAFARGSDFTLSSLAQSLLGFLNKK